ncbi:MAG: SMP-30/gluconolactonase/LRE family protein [Myxococcaceae bacterium]|nr:SMP-30/gluconolactonase/LRE family protein [Myxococcaceae bacterium]
MNRVLLLAVAFAVACGPVPVEADAGNSGGGLAPGGGPAGGASGGAAGGTAGGAAGGSAGGSAGGAAGGTAGGDAGGTAGGFGGGGAAGGTAGGSAGGSAGGVSGLDPIPDGGPTVQRVDGGFQFLEGPLWLADEGALLFTDIPANRIYRYSPTTGFSLFRQNSGGANGLGRLPDGTLLACEHGNRRVSRTFDGGIQSLVERFDGGRFNSPNDIAVAADGTIYFSDPPYGLAGRPAEVPFTGVYRRRPDGTLQVLITDMRRANGVVLSPDESTLYVADSEDDFFRIYRLSPDGGFVSFTQVPTTQQGGGGGDGLGMDDDGNLYVTTGGAPGGGGAVKIYRPDGGYLGRIPVPQNTTNVSFGGADRRTLFITAGTALYQVRLQVPGKP